MALRDPFVVFNAGNNIEAHLVCGLLRDAGIEAAAIEDLSELGVWFGTSLTAFGKPQVWIERADIERARPVVEAFERQAGERRADRGGATESGTPILVTCEECGQPSEFPASHKGSVQDCPHCGRYLDVNDEEGFEGWDFTSDEDDPEA